MMKVLLPGSGRLRQMRIDGTTVVGSVSDEDDGCRFSRDVASGRLLSAPLSTRTADAGSRS